MGGLRYCFTCILLTCWASVGLIAQADLSFAQDKPEVRIGVLSYRGGIEAQRTWGPTIAYLQQALPHITLSYVPMTLQQIAEQADDLHFIITNPGHSFQLERIAGVSRIASARSRKNEDQMHDLASVLFTRSDSPLKTFGDFEKARVGVVSSEAFGGYLAALQTLKHNTNGEVEIDPVPLGFPQQRIVEAVLRGDVQAGIIRACLLESMSAAGKLDLAQVRVIGKQAAGNFACAHTTPLYPGWAFLKVPSVSSELATQITQALLAMPPQFGEDEWLGHSSWIAPVSYASVENVYRELELYPYNKDLPQILQDWVERNYMLIGIAILLCGAFILHVGHVEFLVRRRSRQLEAAGDQLTEALRRNVMLENELAHAGRVSSLNILAGSLAHDLKQPLGAISTFAHSLLQRLERETADKATLQKQLTRISEQANRASEFINSMRSFLNKQPEARRIVDLRDLMDETVMLMRTHSAKHGCQLEWSRPETPVRVCCDDVQLRQVAVVLLQNALDATIEAGLSNGRIVLAMHHDGQTCRITVCDEGSGIPEHIKDQVFEPFCSSKGSLGLGLATAQSIIDSHEGLLKLEPRTPQGTCASVTLPLAPNDLGEDQ